MRPGALPNPSTQGVGVDCHPVDDLSLRIHPKEELLLPPVRLLPHELEVLCSNMTPPRQSVIKIVAIVEFGFRMQVVLSKRLLVGAELTRVDGQVRVPIKAVPDSGDRNSYRTGRPREADREGSRLPLSREFRGEPREELGTRT